MKHIGHRKHLTTFLTTSILALAVVALVGQIAWAGPGRCATKGKKVSCAVEACEAKTTCVKTVSISTEKKSEYTKEECIAKCMALGMTEKEAEACWAKCKEGKEVLHCASREDCITKCMALGMTKKEADACWAKCKEGKDVLYCVSHEDCIAKLMASGLSKKEAEAKYAACKAEAKSSPKCLRSATTAACCPASSGKKNTPK